MNAIRIRTWLESDTLRLPALQPMVGKHVEIIVIEETSPQCAAMDSTRFVATAGTVDIDEDAFWKLREASKI